MNQDRTEPSAARERALDAALARALPPPVLPADFRARLSAAIARQSALEASSVPRRERLEREQRERLAQFEADYIRLRRRTLGTLIGAAFAAGAAVAVMLPWLERQFGPDAGLVLAGAGALIGLAIGSASWIGRLGLPGWLQRF